MRQPFRGADKRDEPPEGGCLSLLTLSQAGEAGMEAQAERESAFLPRHYTPAAWGEQCTALQRCL